MTSHRIGLMRGPRTAQLEYSSSQSLMLEEVSRRAKARKIVAIVTHFLGRSDLDRLRVLDVGSSGGFVADEVGRAGARVVGVDIDRAGVKHAAEHCGSIASFALADSLDLPVATGSVDLVICNHVYEHVVDPHVLIRELRRVVAPDGIIYLGLGNRLGVIEPHYRLPFLSWLPRPIAHRYLRAARHIDYYHESFMTRRGLRRLIAPTPAWDYTLTVLFQPSDFGAGEAMPGALRYLPRRLLSYLMPIVPTYLWVLSPSDRCPAGPPPARPPSRVRPTS